MVCQLCGREITVKNADEFDEIEDSVFLLYVCRDGYGCTRPEPETCEYCDTPVTAPNFAYHVCVGRKTKAG